MRKKGNSIADFQCKSLILLLKLTRHIHIKHFANERLLDRIFSSWLCECCKSVIILKELIKYLKHILAINLFNFVKLKLIFNSK